MIARTIKGALKAGRCLQRAPSKLRRHTNITSILKKYLHFRAEVIIYIWFVTAYVKK
jgi:hypothetical protein